MPRLTDSGDPGIHLRLAERALRWMGNQPHQANKPARGYKLGKNHEVKSRVSDRDQSKVPLSLEDLREEVSMQDCCVQSQRQGRQVPTEEGKVVTSKPAGKEPAM